MAIVIPTPEILAPHALRRAVAKILDLVLAFLARSPSPARHRAASPWEVRVRQWKTLLTDDPARLPDPQPTPDPVPPPTTDDALSTETWNLFHPPPRSAQPTPEPSVEHLIPSTADTIEWPPADYVPPPLYPEIAADRPDTAPADYFPESAFVDTVVLDPVLPDPVVPGPPIPDPTDLDLAALDLAALESAIQAAAVRQTGAAQPTDPDTTSWEFTPGDLAEWWEEAHARLDAAVADHRRQLYGDESESDEWESSDSCDTSEIAVVR